MLALQKVAPGVGHVELRNVAEPSASSNQVLLEVAYAGICGTDLHIYDDEYRSAPPVTMGHEVSATVVAVGEGVSKVQVGDLVTTETYFSYCGVCNACRSGFPNLCIDRRSIGSFVNGGFARYLVVPERNVHKLPANVDLRMGAITEPLACVVRNLLELTGLSAGESTIISGPGPIGLLALQVAKATGATVTVLGTSADEKRMAAARKLGADAVLNVQELGFDKIRSKIMEHTNGNGVDVVFECAGAGPSAANALQLVRRGGRYGQVGLYGKPIQFEMDIVCYKELKLFGSFATVPSSWRRALALLERGVIDVETMVSDIVPLTEWEDAFARLRAKDALKIMFAPGLG